MRGLATRQGSEANIIRFQILCFWPAGHKRVQELLLRVDNQNRVEVNIIPLVERVDILEPAASFGWSDIICEHYRQVVSHFPEKEAH